jgi:predicted dinucleotide-utilizing enzyme
MAAESKRCRVGIVGYGSVGAYFVDRILNDAPIRDKLELSFVWNRSVDKLRALGSMVLPEAVLEDLDGFSERPVDIVVELCHPSVAKAHGAAFLSHADFFVGSPTAFADAEADATLRRSCRCAHRLKLAMLPRAHDIPASY